ncbi:3-hydroxyacyl-CoA dehydrogenase NAD-binding [Caldalkalibacillus thermarum TA2.A1]|uniref:3-hydroxyacyl-CoA dehydrogenase n=1 Tax=Caldalkalibacillus thermarum (strain TA2.A1) TaxID=986075 RepID=F5L5X5_CALTT|nr:3-hydroxyacyl-CoA dehydrogenase [Caldalkalibacillus thermarum]EGL83248.1 3-hydroxyacyl-CoA dehydrogenase NAD-binding [Caldalkalibacillus thermarum TA2.A1]QZT35491.1 3-hydroxyacyl-CoA dehydrogenase [Caldalkalibacillus thermarum TA2.A1]
MRNLTVIGAGVMGRGIAYVGAFAGFQVYVHDISEEALDRAESEIKREMEKSVQKGYLSQQQMEEALQRILYTTNLEEAAREADLVIEAVLEVMDIKIDVFKKLDQICPPHTVLATNTSTMSPTEIAAQTSRPDKCIAMHFFNPPHKMKLIELVRGLDTSDKTVAFAKHAAEQMGKETVEVNEFPGFVTSRMNCLIGNEAMYMLMEGVASAEDIDKAIKLGLNHPMGPLELADLVGLDTRLRNMEYLYQTLGEKYRPCPLLIKYVKAGRLGRKSGRGFYNYEE